MALYVIVELYIIRSFVIDQWLVPPQKKLSPLVLPYSTLELISIFCLGAKSYIADLLSSKHDPSKKTLCTKDYNEGLHGLMAVCLSFSLPHLSKEEKILTSLRRRFVSFVCRHSLSFKFSTFYYSIWLNDILTN